MTSSDKKSRRKDLLSGSALFFVVGVIALLEAIYADGRPAYIAAATAFAASGYALFLAFRKGADDSEAPH